MLDLMARRYGQRPSHLVKIRDPYVAYCFDEAIAFRAILEQKPRDNQNSLTLSGGVLSGDFSGVIGDY